MYDCIIIGGGPAGLSAALTLGRSCRKTHIIDDKNPRSQVTRFSHGFLTRDGVLPKEFRNLAQQELANYPSVSIETDLVVDVHNRSGSFEIVTNSGDHFSTKKLLFATGLKDILPKIEGLKSVYGISAFICPYCDGWEFREQPIAIIGSKLADIHFVKALHGWSRDIILFTNGPAHMEKSQIDRFLEKNIPIYEEKIKCIEHDDGILQSVLLEDGARISRKAIFFNPEVRQASLLPQKLGVGLNDLQLFITEEDGKTNIDGLYIAGDSRNHLHQIIHAASDGAKAAVSINMELLKEEWKHG
jgi:thioredoxin reductase